MEISNKSARIITQAWLFLKYTYGLLFVVAGADKFFNLVTHWQQYASPVVTKLFPVPLTTFMISVGIIEIIIGLLILTKHTRLGAYLAMTWLLLIVINLVSMGTFFDIAVRDIVMAIGAYILAQLTDVHEAIVNR